MTFPQMSDFQTSSEARAVELPHWRACYLYDTDKKKTPQSGVLQRAHPHQVLSRTMIADHVWDVDADHLSNVIDVYIGYVRTKLCACGEPNVIQTLRGSGYQLKEPEE